jgi:hypothetical protein
LFLPEEAYSHSRLQTKEARPNPFLLAWILYKKLRILNNWSIGYPAARELSGKANKFLANVDG